MGGSFALAQPGPVVLLASEDRNTELHTQLRAELFAMGLTVTEIPWSIAEDSAFRVRGASVLLKVQDPKHTVLVAFLDDDGAIGPNVQTLGPPLPLEETRSLALRVAELVRATLLPTASPPDASLQEGKKAEAPGPEPAQATSTAAEGKAPASEVSVTREDAAESNAPPSRPRPPLRHRPFWLGLGPSLGLDVDGFGLGLRAELAAFWELKRRLTFWATLLAPTWAQTLQAPEGRADLRLGLIQVGARRELTSQAARFRPHVGLGAGALLTHLVGHAQSPNRSASQLEVAAVASLALGAAIRLSPRTRLALDFHGGLAAPRNVVRFADRKVGSVGMPLLLSSLSLQVALD